jgi:hypothetical protein
VRRLVLQEAILGLVEGPRVLIDGVAVLRPWQRFLLFLGNVEGLGGGDAVVVVVVEHVIFGRASGNEGRVGGDLSGVEFRIVAGTPD